MKQFEYSELLDLLRSLSTSDQRILIGGQARDHLTSTGETKRLFGSHSFRRSFVIRSLALGKGEDWVRYRSGHKLEALLRYRQAAMALAELELGEVEPPSPIS